MHVEISFDVFFLIYVYTWLKKKKSLFIVKKENTENLDARKYILYVQPKFCNLL